MINLNALQLAGLCILFFIAGALSEWLRKENKKGEATHAAYRLGYTTGYQTAELKLGPSRPEPEDFEEWPPIPPQNIIAVKISEKK